MSLNRVVVLVFALALAFIPSGASAQQRDGGATVRGEINGHVVVEEGERLDALGAVFSDVEIDGTIVQLAVLYECETVIRGTIDGNVFIFGGSVRFEPTALINGTVNVNEGSILGEPTVAPGGEIRVGDGPSFDAEIPRGAAWFALASWGGISILALVAAVVFAGVGGRQLWSSANLITSRPVQTVLAIVALWVFGGILTVVLFITILGIPVAGALVLALTFIWMLGYLVAGTRIGAALTGRSTNDVAVNHPYLPAVVGIIVLQAIAFVPVATMIILTFTGYSGSFRLTPLNVLFLSAWWSASMIVWIIGTLGAGAVTYRAFQAWRSNDPAAAA